MTIAFVHPHKAFLPDIEAYRHFFEAYGIPTAVYNARHSANIKADVQWHFMGLHTSRKKCSIVIHEYASVSTPPLAFAKDALKRWMNIAPDYRLFYNDFVKKRMAFNDAVPWGIRDYGILPFQEKKLVSKDKKWDFIYVGSTDANRKLNPLYELFINGPLRDKNLLVLSRNYEHIAQKLASCKNIQFEGPLSAAEVYPLIRSAKFGINYIPDREPFISQTSSKLIDYLACETPVITTDYEWVRKFQSEVGGAYFYLNKDLSNFNWEKINAFKYVFPDLKELSWEQRIRKSGILALLENTFPAVHF